MDASSKVNPGQTVALNRFLKMQMLTGENRENSDLTLGLIDVSGVDTQILINEHFFLEKTTQASGLRILDFFIELTENNSFMKKLL